MLLTDIPCIENIEFKIDTVLGSPHNSPLPSIRETKPGPRLDPETRLRSGKHLNNEETFQSMLFIPVRVRFNSGIQRHPLRTHLCYTSHLKSNKQQVILKTDHPWFKL